MSFACIESKSETTVLAPHTLHSYKWWDILNAKWKACSRSSRPNRMVRAKCCGIKARSITSWCFMYFKQVYYSHNIAACQSLTGWITELCTLVYLPKKNDKFILLLIAYATTHSIRFPHQSTFWVIFCGAYTIHQKSNIFTHSVYIYSIHTSSENKRRQDDTETISIGYYAEKVPKCLRCMNVLGVH